MSYKGVVYHVREALDHGYDVMLVTIADTKGSTPRHQGAIMAMDSTGRFYGTIGGGKIEAVAMEECKRLMETGELMEVPDRSRSVEYKLNTKDKDAIDMGCGGDANVKYTHISADEPERFNADVEVETAYIFGGGHIGLALEPVLRHIGFDTVVIDDREEFANRERFPEASEVCVVDSYKNSFDGIECDRNSYIIIVTRGHKGDLDVLRDALKQKYRYLGMIGSRTKNETLYGILREEGVSDADIAKVHAPIGLAIHSETPEEISISIAAEVIVSRSGHDEERSNI